MKKAETLSLSNKNYDLRDKAEIERAEHELGRPIVQIWEASYGVSEFIIEVGKRFPEILPSEDRPR